MHEFIKCFVRDSYGSWLCIEPGEVELPQGRIQVTPGLKLTRGTIFMGLDLARLLEEEYRKSDPGSPRP